MSQIVARQAGRIDIIPPKAIIKGCLMPTQPEPIVKTTGIVYQRILKEQGSRRYQVFQETLLLGLVESSLKGRHDKFLGSCLPI